MSALLITCLEQELRPLFLRLIQTNVPSAQIDSELRKELQKMAARGQKNDVLRRTNKPTRAI